MGHGRLVAASLSFVALAASAGCATIIKGTGPEPVSIRSTPSDADVKVIDIATGNVVHQGKTPFVVSLHKSRGFFQGSKYRVVFEKPGFTPREVTLDTRVSAWYVAGNLVFGGLIGWLIVDPASGAMWTLSDEEIAVDLSTPAQPAPAPATAPAPAPADAAQPRASAATGAARFAVMTLDELAEQHPDLVSRMHAVAPN